MAVTAAMRAAVPSPLYSCADERCAEYVSYPADMLWWHDRRGVFYCEDCHDGEWQEGDEIWSESVSLKTVLQGAGKPC